MKRWLLLGMGSGCVLAAGVLAVEAGRSEAAAREDGGYGPGSGSQGFGGHFLKEGPRKRAAPRPRLDEKVYVAGRVVRPGVFHWSKGLTVGGAVEKAGGADEFGAVNRVLVTHGGSVKAVSVKREGEEGRDLLLEPGDQWKCRRRCFSGVSLAEVPRGEWRICGGDVRSESLTRFRLR